MTLYKWFKLISLALGLIISDQFFKTAFRNWELMPEKTSSAFTLGYREQTGWLSVDNSMSVTTTFKKLLMNQYGLFSLFVLLTLLMMYQKSQRTNDPSYALPYACIVAGIVSIWLDQTGFFGHVSRSIQWLTLNGSMQFSIAFAEVYLGLGVALFLWKVKNNEIVQ